MKRYLLLLIIMFLCACGRKAPPLPIEKSLPKEPELEIETTPLGVNLWITLPTTTQGGYPLNKIKALIIEKEEVSLAEPSKIKKKRIKLSPKLHSAANLYLYTDKELKSNFLYKYRLKIEKDFLVKSAFTEEKMVFWTTPPFPPSNIKIIPISQEEIELVWDPPFLNLNKEPLQGEIYYRLEKITSFERKFIEVRDRHFRDKRSHDRVCYQLQTLLKFYETIIPSPFSETLCYP
ncbi:MAG: hypothetical protein ACK4K4_02620 [Caldimicrobium sp.]